MNTDIDILVKLENIVPAMSTENIGDIYVYALDLYTQITDRNFQQIGESYLAKIRDYSRKAEIGWILFNTPFETPAPLDDEQQIQIMTMIMTLHAFCYGVERLEETSMQAGPTSVPVRFYINSIYHYIADLYLLDKDNDPIGGMVYKTLEPLGLSILLNPIIEVIDKPLETGVSFGETVRKMRNDLLIHGTFWQEDVLANDVTTNVNGPGQFIKLNKLIWELFNQTFILKLRLIAMLTAMGTKPNELIGRYFGGEKAA